MSLITRNAEAQFKICNESGNFRVGVESIVPNDKENMDDL